MEPISAGLLAFIGAIMVLLGFLYVKGIVKAGFTKTKTAAGVGIAMVVLGFYIVGGAMSPALLSGVPFLSAIAPTEALSLGGSLGDNNALTGGVDSNTGAAIATVTGTVTEALSNNLDAADGFIKFFDPSVDPSGANAQPVDTITMTDGSGSTTNARLKDGGTYRVVWEGNSTNTNYYDKDLGEVTLTGVQENLNTLTFDVGAVQLVGTLDDMIDETSTAINGQSGGCGNNTAATAEIQCDGDTATADDTVLYDESVGDGTWYIDVTPSCSGSYGVCRQAVLHFQHDQTNPPETNEYSKITAQLQSGTNFGVDSELIDYWASEIPILLGDMNAGISGTYRFTFTVDESNEDGNDDWTLRFDDLGEFLGRDVRLNTRATADTFTYGGSKA